ncbi:MAG: alpha-mannosidase [Limisphaerales bacterium]
MKRMKQMGFTPAVAFPKFWSVLFLTCFAVLFFGVRAFADSTNAPLDLSHQPTLYEIGYSHLDTEWRWAYPQVISEFLPNTVHDNLALFQKYPHYIFNWTGAGRYQLIKEYHPDDFEKVREEVAAGHWWPAGSSWEENDVNVPSSESIIRQLLLGHEFFKKEFGTESSDYMLPDCFGFPASLPSILAHCGIRGFSTQKLTWGSAVGIPFNVGEWIGPDGNSVIAALNPGGYGSQVKDDRSHDAGWLKRIEADGAKSGVFADYAYFGTGDRGGAPNENSVKWIEKSVTSDGPLRVICARADEMFRDISDAQKARLPKYKGDLLLTEHSTGSLTSEAYMKRWNHENELLADAAERASVAAYILGAAPYPREKLNAAWELVLRSQMHDMLPGTCLPKAYEYIWNDEIIAMNSFAETLRNAVGAVATGLDTRADSAGAKSLVVYNPLSIAREDVAEAQVKLSAATGVQVFDGDGNPVPTQLLSSDGEKCDFLFLAKVPSVGFAVFSVKKTADTTAPSSSLKVTDRSLENSRYRVTLNDAGDIASVFDKTAKRELLSAPARLEFLTQNPDHYPAWNMRWADQSQPPRGYVNGPATFRVIENGPVRVAIQVRREAEGSTFVQTIRLAAGAAGDHVEIENNVNWQSKACSLKAEFPLTVSNSLATYNWELGKVQRGNDDPKKFEVPSHEWFDLTDTKGNYGVSILCPKKYGSDKPSDNVLRLTLLYSPGMQNADSFHEQRWQDWGRHEFIYGIYGHDGDWRTGESDWQAARLDQPMFVFQTAPHEGKLGRSFSLLKVNSDTVAVRAIKLAEDSNQVIVRLQELNGTTENFVRLTTSGLKSAAEVNGLEKFLNPVRSWFGLWLDFTPYQLRSLALTLNSPVKLSSPVSMPVALPYNLDAFSFRAAKTDGDFDGNGSTIPAGMIGDTVTGEGIKFQIGPRANGQQNAVQCEGQTIALPAGQFNELYLLAAAVGGDADGDFSVDGSSTPLHVQNWTGYIGRWDNRVFEGDVPALTYSVNNPLLRIDAGFIKRDPLAWFCSHRNLPDGVVAIYSYSYLFKYRIPISAGATTLTLPDNPRIRVIAASVAQDNNDATQPAQPLYDDFSNRKPIILPDGWANSK